MKSKTYYRFFILLALCLSQAACLAPDRSMASDMVLQSDPRLASDATLPSGGGYARNVSSGACFDFTPDTSGLWAIYTSDNYECDPSLSIFGPDGELVAYDEDSGSRLTIREGMINHAGNYDYIEDSGSYLNARIVTRLEAGTTYRIEVVLSSTGRGSSYNADYCTLTAALESKERLSNSGGSVRIFAETYYDFTPASSGLWSFQTSDKGAAYPILALYDHDGSLIMFDHNDGWALQLYLLFGHNLREEVLDARMVAFLEAGKTYQLYAGFIQGNNNPYTLDVTAMQTATLPEAGGELRVEKTTYYAFSPDKSGRWRFDYSDWGGGCYPYLTLYNARGELMAEYRAHSGRYIRMAEYLEAGSTYYLFAGYDKDREGFYSTAMNPFTLTIYILPTLYLPGGGGSVQVTREAEYIFTPDRSGDWEVHALWEGLNRPYFIFYDPRERKAIRANILGDRVVEYLDAGFTYAIYAGYITEQWQDPYTLSLSPIPTLFLPTGGGSMRVSEEADYVFRPDKSGFWLIRTSDNGDDGCNLTVYDARGEKIAVDGINHVGSYSARIVIYLHAGSTYTIRAAGVLGMRVDGYTLTTELLSTSPLPAAD